ncbi:hypothetical protein PQ455_14840 [Sphingomonas naphthae]|uniref:Flagellar assembly protein FliH/Type III secretion system HrpE domain-containing protein n=1 Tax=Sphingomonas naphthae TaxID=1813468 RepID=A0ABY7TI49_9SPHN|nr:hypothetical protein [Sphingomonas naphthae]WCT72901.1 hypothetical protein PQ455_14840 [Sphingomonas naphthae]
MSDMWSAAATVPVWTRPAINPAASFRPRDLAQPQPTGFSPWAAEAEPEPGQDFGHDEYAAAPAPSIDIERLRAEAFADGFEEGRRTVMLEVSAERADTARLTASLEALKPEAPQALATLLSETVRRLVAGIVGQVTIDDDMLRAQTDAAATIISEECAPSRLRVSPADAERLAGADIPVELYADPALAPGMVVAETSTGWIEDGPEVRLQRLHTALTRLGAAR